MNRGRKWANYALELKDISKRFGSVQANDQCKSHAEKIRDSCDPW